MNVLYISKTYFLPYLHLGFLKLHRQKHLSQNVLTAFLSSSDLQQWFFYIDKFYIQASKFYVSRTNFDA